ncbi:hypothetical protein K469DRAFT_609963 [Zopfia rhizophila CBS 207.26]|uniref:Transcription initiation factor TFIID subunit 8 n=1 Tax=Zopfia rhizophila CBS 207.26 TaxID=1314779 RepID=A0A6A6D8A2_9PEZI|nr:hypothetical protein K469DRAFT_609963 [Zopfia rhizophila CBS 207.26]
MAGIRTQPDDSSVHAGIKRLYGEEHAEEAPSTGRPNHKKRKIKHQLLYKQSTHHITDYVSSEFDPESQNKGFFNQQLFRAIGITCKAVGFDSARPEALEALRGLAEEFILKFLGDVRSFMSNARRTEPIPDDWIYALSKCGIKRSSQIEQQLDTGEIPPTFLQPELLPPASAELLPADLEPLVGPELSGKSEKESKPWIPKHFPPFPSKHTYKDTPVYVERETDRRKLREKATEEGKLAAQALRKLMAAKKAGLQKKHGITKPRQSKRRKKSDKLWEEAMESVLNEEERELRTRGLEDIEYRYGSESPRQTRREKEKEKEKRNEEEWKEGMQVNYEKKYWRQAATQGVAD